MALPPTMGEIVEPWQDARQQEKGSDRQRCSLSVSTTATIY